MGEVQVRVLPAGYSGFPYLCPFPRFVPFSLLSWAIPYKPVLGFSVYICLFCINALGLRETPSRLGLHNNARGLRESSSRLGLQKMPLVCVSPRHDLVCNKCP